MTIHTLHLIFKTHLDLGFTHYAADVAQEYFTHYFPKAMQTARTQRAEDPRRRFVWTTAAWLVDAYLDQASPAQRREIEQAIEDGDLIWHGLPFTMHSELLDPALFRHGLSIAKRLDARFGRQTIAAKATDVPGHTRGIVPLLAEAGIEFLHIGVNEASTPPNVPPVFVWRDEEMQTELTVMYVHAYGATQTAPGLDEAIAFAHTNDNAGPQTPDQVRDAYDHLQADYPDARIVASSLDDFARALRAVKADLPVVTGEIGDTWIHGAGTDPSKLSDYKVLRRLHRQWTENKVDIDPIAWNRFADTLLCVPEHTWGMDEKTHLDDYAHYSRADFERVRHTHKWEAFAASWAEQRAYVDAAVAALQGTPLHAEASEALTGHRAERTQRPDLANFTPVSLSAPLRTPHFDVAFDETGAINHLVDAAGNVWATPANVLGLLRYQTFDNDDYERFMDQYLDRSHWWGILDFSMPGLEKTDAISRWWLPSLQAAYLRQDASEWTVLAQLSLPPDSTQQFGAPAAAWIRYVFAADAPRVDVTVHWFDKPANRLPEALWLTFNPSVDTPDAWQMSKLGRWISPLDVVDRGNHELHAVDTVRNGMLHIETWDAALMSPGAPKLLNFQNKNPDLRGGVHFNLYNNVWGTNFPMWYDDDARFRFRLSFGEG
ncbi:MAG: DUF5054 domain-containing protein [Caldilineaceae bacterium]